MRIVGEEVHFLSVLASAVNGSQWLTSYPGHYTPGKEPWHPMNRS